MSEHLWLVGMMGSGKSVVGPALAERLDMSFFDTDEVVVRRVGCGVAEFWGKRGEAAFRNMESAALVTVADGDGSVNATGGGAVLSEANRNLMRDTGKVVWLRATPATLASRLAQFDSRPLLAEGASADTLTQILVDRTSAYSQAAHWEVVTDPLDEDAVVREIEAWWNE